MDQKTGTILLIFSKPEQQDNARKDGRINRFFQSQQMISYKMKIHC
jgi:hypothetical protein